jgi:hypothetical protein
VIIELNGNIPNYTIRGDEMKRMICGGWIILFFVISALSGCVTTPKGPLQPDEVRLIKLKIVETTTGKKHSAKNYKAIIEYQHGMRIKPDDIRLACTTWYWDTLSEGPNCGRPVTVDNTKIEINSSVGVIRTYTIGMYVVYLVDGKEKKSNLIKAVHSF